MMYSAEDVADMLGLHVRTVRGYVRDGRLPAVRIGKQYRISERDLRELTGDEAPAPPRVEATSIVQIDGLGRELADRIVNLVIAAANSEPAVHVQTFWKQDTLKVVAVGDPDDTAQVLSMISALVKDEPA